MAEAPKNRIAELRAAAGLTQQELAEAVGVHWVTISKLERGKTRLNLDWMAKIAPILNVASAELMPEDVVSASQASKSDGKLLGDRIRDFRIAAGLSQDALAHRSGVNQSTLQRWETGGVPPADVIPSIAESLGVPILALFDMDDGVRSHPKLGLAHTEALQLFGDRGRTDMVARSSARDKIIALAERLKIEAAQGFV